MADDPRTQAIAAIVDAWLAEDPFIADSVIELARTLATAKAGKAVDAIPGDVHARLAADKGAMWFEGYMSSNDVGHDFMPCLRTIYQNNGNPPPGAPRVAVYRLVDPPHPEAGTDG